MPSLEAMGLPTAIQTITTLSGGVSCDVVRVSLPGRTIVLKRALPRLRVAADWQAPAERSQSETAWLKLAAGIVPGAVPRVIGEDHGRNVFAMDYLPAEDHPVWKARLAAGAIDPRFARSVGGTLARIHSATAGRADVAGNFANAERFHALRLEPFLVHVAGKHPALASRLLALADGIARARIALMHGDVSPKNILCGPHGPVFLDAETACYGDPAFDAAFCLTHLLLKCVWHPEWADGYGASVAEFVEGYRSGADWEAWDGLERRIAAILPALLLARVDGKSPADYLDTPEKTVFVRSNALALLEFDITSLDAVLHVWGDAARRERNCSP
jgi:aminoglycoside phosphotransferase (APT) family kinase protein